MAKANEVRMCVSYTRDGKWRLDRTEEGESFHLFIMVDHDFSPDPDRLTPMISFAHGGGTFKLVTEDAFSTLVENYVQNWVPPSGNPDEGVTEQQAEEALSEEYICLDHVHGVWRDVAQMTERWHALNMLASFNVTSYNS